MATDINKQEVMTSPPGWEPMPFKNMYRYSSPMGLVFRVETEGRGCGGGGGGGGRRWGRGLILLKDGD